MRRLAALVIAAAVALLVVSGAMLFGMGKPAQAQETYTSCTSSPSGGDVFCLDKTAPSTATVGSRSPSPSRSGALGLLSAALELTL
jgi:hypothetical protein